MTTIVKFLLTLLLSFLFMSCTFNYSLSGVKGNGNVVTESRLSETDFHSVKATEGLNVFLTQSTSNKVKVQADDNLQELIITEVKDGVLHIHTLENIGKASSKKVLVNYTNLREIISTSGAEVRGTNKMTGTNLSLKATSGSDIRLELDATEVHCKSTSGGEIKLTGKANSIVAKATSGSAINASNLITQNCDTSVTSGADIDVNCNKQLAAHATSGGDITYKGNPSELSKTKNSSGSISKR